MKKIGRFYIENAAAISLKYIGPDNDSTPYGFEKEDSQLKAAEPAARYCTVRESLEDSLKEVKEIRDGKKSEGIEWQKENIISNTTYLL